MMRILIKTPYRVAVDSRQDVIYPEGAVIDLKADIAKKLIISGDAIEARIVPKDDKSAKNEAAKDEEAV
jgi:hypothetical protein